MAEKEGAPTKMTLPDKEAKRIAAGAEKNSQSGAQNNPGSVGYAKGTVANVPISKSAQMAGGGTANTLFTQPMFFSPLHTPQNWQIASKRQEVYQWLLTGNSNISTKDYTFKSISELDFSSSEVIEDSLTGGLLYEDINSEEILGAKGEMRRPSRYAVRECVNKRCFAFKATGYYREVEVSEEHPMIVLDGKKYRHKKKIEQNANYRRKQNIPKGGDKPCIKYDGSLICRKEAQDVDIQDYLLCPLPNTGNESLNSDNSWMIGQLIADGTLCDYETGKEVRVTLGKDEYHLPNIIRILKSDSKKSVRSFKHGDGNGWRVSVLDSQTFDIYAPYITGKLTQKKLTEKAFQLDKETRLHLLGGYFDGDGSYNSTSKKLIANNYSEDMADQLYFMLLSVGISCNLSRVPLYGEHYDTASEWCYRLIIPSSEIPKLQPYMRSNKIPENFEPKKSRELRFIYQDEDGTEFLAQPIDYKKEFLYTGPCYDIQVDPDRAFVASGYVTSNCRFYYENEPKVAAGIDFYCFTPEMQVLMANGEQKKISSVQVGDSVRSHDGSINKVNNVFVREAAEDLLVIKISGVSTRTLNCTKGHELLVERDFDYQFVHAEDVEVGDYLLTPIGYDGYVGQNLHEQEFVKGDYVYRKILEIEKYNYNGKVYDLEIDNSHSYVVNEVAVHNSQFPINGLKLECKSKKVQKFFEDLIDKLDLLRMLRLISHERFLLGDVFVFLEFDSPDARGETGLPPDQWDHAGGTINRIVILNPDWVEVYNTPLADEPEIVMLPDDELKKIVQTKQPQSVYERLPEQVKELVAAGRPIRLSNRATSHIKHGGAPYGTYGDSLLRRLFTVLAYKTKLMTANWIVAERLVLPVRVVKVGDKDRPASEDDINDVQQQLGAVANDPNMTIVTHHAFEYEWYGACYDDETEFLTQSDGFVKAKDVIYEEVDDSNDIIDDNLEVMVFDPDSGQMWYEKPLAVHVYDYDGYLTHFNGNKVDISVTPNHTMLGYKRDKSTAYCMEAKDFAKINESDRHVRCVGDYIAEPVDYVNLDDHKIHIDDFLAFAGYYLSEGYCEIRPEKHRYVASISQSPKVNPDYCDDIDSFMPSICDYSKYYYEDRCSSWNIFNPFVVDQICDWFGKNSDSKRIPSFVKNLPPDKLEILINAFANGDASKYNYKTTNAIQIGSNSDELIDDLCEVLFKAGYSPVKSRYIKSGTNQKMLYCNVTHDGKGRFPRIKDSHVNAMRYKGKVWCFETSTGFFVTRRNGKISIQGNTGKIHNITNELELIGKELLDGMMLNQALLNGEMASYSSSQVGVEMLIRRLETWRNELAEWVEKNIFLPVAKMQGFVDEEESKDRDPEEKAYLYPRIKWDDMKLRDPSNRLQQAIQLNQNGIISNQTLLEMFDLDYDQEVRRLREEQVMTGSGGDVMGQQGGIGPMGGAMGGEMSGGMPGGEMGGEMGGGMPGGEMGGGMPGGEMGGAPAGGDMAGGMGGAAAQSSPPQRVYKKGKAPKEDEQQPPVKPQTFQLTKVEAKAMRVLEELSPPYKLYVQYGVQVPGEQQPFKLDFAYPEIGLNIEADGDQWHSSMEDKQSDNQRDAKLANMGWTVVRVSEDSLNENVQEVKKLIAENIKEAANIRRKLKKKSQNIGNSKFVQASYREQTVPYVLSISKSRPSPDTE